MYKHLSRTIVLSWVLTAFVAATAWAEDKPKDTTMPETPAEWIVLEEDWWIPTYTEPSEYFHSARRAFLNRDLDEAARELRKAETLMRIDARKAKPTESKTSLWEAVYSLRTVAKEVEDKQAKDVGYLDHAFARTHHGLAKHYYMMTVNQLGKSPAIYSRTIGHYVNATAKNLEDGCAWANQKMDSSGRKAVNEAYTIGDALIKGSSRKNEEIRKVAETLNSEIDKLSEALNKSEWAGSNYTGAGPVAKNPPSVPEGWFLVQNDIWYPVVDEPEYHFHLARQHLLKKEYKAAAREIEKAGAFVRLQLGHASTVSKKILRPAIRELDDLAVDVRKGTVDSAKKLDRVFANVDHALARHFNEKASEAWVAKEEHKAGHYLKAAAHYVENGVTWTGREMESGTKTVLKDAGTMAGKLIEGAGWTTEEVGKGIEYVGKEVEKLGKML